MFVLSFALGFAIGHSIVNVHKLMTKQTIFN